MADDIRAAVASETQVDALIVSIPSKAVASAVRYAAEQGMPVFGVKSGFEFASGPEGLVEDGSLLFFTATDERLGGEKAASYFLEEFSGGNFDENNVTNLTNSSYVTQTHVTKKYTDALFVSPLRATNSAYEQRFEGYRDRLLEASNSTINVEWIEVNPPGIELLKEKLSNCMYQSVLVCSGRLLPSVADAIKESGCNRTKIGSFDPIPEMDYHPAKGEMDFVIDQFHLLQGWAPVLFAALYVTTGLVLAPPPGGVYLSGPALFTKKNSTMGISNKLCKKDVNRIGSSPLDRGCPHRKDITIGGVVHGTTTDKFWDTVFSAAKQGAIDMGIELKFDRFKTPESNEILYEEMAAKILSLCKSGVNGLFVTLPDDVVVDAVRSCKELYPNVQIMSINAGYGESKELNLIHHIGMVEKDAGYQAGEKMGYMATFDKALCLNQDPGLTIFNDRCEGFGQAMNDMGIAYLGQIEVPANNITRYTSIVEKAVGESGDWDGYGILLTELSQLPSALELKNLHVNFVIGSFDTNDVLYKSLETGDVLFGIDQQPFFQGYLPIPILTHAAIKK